MCRIPVEKRTYSLSLLLSIGLLIGCERTSPSPVEIKIDDDSGYTSAGTTVSGSTLMTTHIVNNNETLFDVAYKYNVDPMNLAEINGIRSPYTVRNGQILKLPGEGKHESKPFIEENVLNIPDAENDKKLDAEFDEIMAVNKAAAAVPTSPKSAALSKGTSFNEQALARDKAKDKPKEKLKENAKPAATAAKPASAASSKLIKPVDGKIISKFGQMLDDIPNDGINIKASLGTKIKAAGSGKVIYAGNGLQDEFGNVVIIKHDNDLITSYAHLKEIKIKNGVRVNAGDIIGTVGKTGDVKTPQLHFEVMKNKKPVNPEQYISAK